MIELINQDPNFSENKFLSFADNVFIQLYLAMMKGNLEETKHFISKNVYEEFKSILDELNNKNERQIFGEINVKESKIFECIEKENSFILRVHLVSRYLDYVVDKTTGKKLRGNDTNRIEKNNILEFERIKDYKERTKIIKCANCGANLDINHSGKCIYCGQIYKQEDYDWVLISIMSN